MTLLANARRLTRLARVLVAHGLAHTAGQRLESWPWLAKRLPSGTCTGPQRLSAVFEDLGGSFLKFGQMLALQPDILSLEYCNALFNLLDRVAPFPYSEVERICQEELGKSPEDLFESFERTPLATASIGQVHVARLHGKNVAFKVQRPVVDRDFKGDIQVMTGVVRLIRLLRLRSLEWMIEPMSEFAAWTQEELDYRHEARYMRQMRDNCAGSQSEVVPEVFFVTRRLLAAEFLEGVTVLDYLRALETGDEVKLQRLKAMGFEPNECARRMIDNFLGDAFRFGLFHADLHPANLMILPGNVIGYIDFGITGVLSKHSRLHLVHMTLAYTRADTAGMCAAFLRVSAMDDSSDLAGFRRGLEKFGESWYETARDGSRLKKNFTLVMLDMLRLSRATSIWPERDVIKYIRSAIAIDGLITRFAPGFSVGDYLAAVCDRTIRQQARKSLLSRDHLVGWAQASSSLLRDGVGRFAELASRLAAGRWGEASDTPRGLQGSGLEAQALRLSAVACAIAVTLTVSGQPAEIGWNVFTAGATLVVAALALLGRIAFRLPS